MIKKINIYLYKRYLKKSGLALSDPDDYQTTQDNTTITYTVNILKRLTA